MAKCTECLQLGMSVDHGGTKYQTGYFVEDRKVVTVKGAHAVFVHARQTGLTTYWDRSLAERVARYGDVDLALHALAKETIGLSDDDYAAYSRGDLAALPPHEQIRWFGERGKAG